MIKYYVSAAENSAWLVSAAENSAWLVSAAEVHAFVIISKVWFMQPPHSALTPRGVLTQELFNVKSTGGAQKKWPLRAGGL